MKAESTPENKARFFAQYHGQEVAYIPDYDQGTTIIKSRVDRVNEIKYLELKPLSAISDEDAIEVAMILFDDNDHLIERSNNECKVIFTATGESFSIWFDSEIIVEEFHTQNPIGILSCYDFLRSRGYALPWMGLTVSELIQAGWVKLQTSQS